MRSKLRIVQQYGGEQRPLALPDPSLLVFYSMDADGGARLPHALNEVRPKLVFDLRRLPRFDFNGVSRYTVFRSFEDFGAKYFDVGAFCRIPRDLTSSLDSILPKVGELLTEVLGRPMGPVLFLLESPLSPVTRFEVPTKLPAPAGGWHVRSA